VRRRTGRAAATAAAAALALAGCGGGTTSSTGAGSAAESSASSSGPSAAAAPGTLTVLAAASLTEAFTTLGKQFEAAHPGTTVRFSFGPSSGLAEQIAQGAPADVFASASTASMHDVVDSGDAAKPTAFASNSMEIAVPPANPAGITGVADLARSGVKVALCQPEVPCGSTAQQVFDNASVTVHPVTLEEDVKATLTKVQLDEVDAGVVYVTDVRAAGSKVKGIPIPAQLNASTAYPIAALTASTHATQAQSFVAFVLSAHGQSVLTRAGFRKP